MHRLRQILAMTALLAMTAVGFASPAAAYVVCNRWGDCWHVQSPYYYNYPGYYYGAPYGAPPYYSDDYYNSYGPYYGGPYYYGPSVSLGFGFGYGHPYYYGHGGWGGRGGWHRH